MTLFVTWLLFPLLMVAVCLGCGLLLERACGTRIPGALLVPAGLAVVVVSGEFTTATDATAELTTPLVVVLALAGYALGGRGGRLRLDSWAVGAAVAVFAVYAAPIVLSGQATFAGYIKLDDTATWMAFTDRIMTDGYNLSGLAPSSYQQTLVFNLGQGYPIGAFIPLGVGHELVGQDVAWVIQPYMALLAAFLATGFYAALSSLVEDRRLRAVAAFIGAQPALLYGYYLWGGIKELSAAALVATAAALAGVALRRRLEPRSLGPLAVGCAAIVSVLSPGGAVWLGPILLGALVLGFFELERDRTALAIRAAGFAAAVALLCVPVLTHGLVPPTSLPLTSSEALGNLIHPLSVKQLAGIWPVGDFRLRPDSTFLTNTLIVLVVASAAGGVYAAWRRRSWSLLLYAAGALVTGIAIEVIGSPWVAGKALATASPALPLLAAAGACTLFGIGRRLEGALVLLALGFGVLWSNALAYQDVNLAPRAQLAELEAIGERIGGQGPTLMTEYMPYGVRHFLRDADPEGASELRYHHVYLLDGSELPKGETADTDRFQLTSLLQYRTLVLRRSPAQSLPPSPFRLLAVGHYYEVWQRPSASPGSDVLQHMGLGNRYSPIARPSCSGVMKLAHAAGVRRLAAAERSAADIIPLPGTRHPTGWGGVPGGLVPRTAGTITAPVHIKRAGDYEVWLGGGVRPEVDLYVDGRQAGSVRHQLENFGEYVSLGTARLSAGRHTISVHFDGKDAHPGSGGAPDPIGPLTLSPEDTAQTRIRYFRPADARSLCGRSWDWIEALSQ